MFDPGAFTANGLLCLAALFVAGFVRRGRREAVTLAALLCANYLFCALGYTPYAPKYALAAAGVLVTTKELWAFADALLGCAAVLAFRRWWGWALWALAVTQEVIHGGYALGWYSDAFYTDRLDNVLHAQIALFFLIGGRGCVDFLRNCLTSLRSSCATSATSCVRAVARRCGGPRP